MRLSSRVGEARGGAVTSALVPSTCVAMDDLIALLLFLVTSSDSSSLELS